MPPGVDIPPNLKATDSISQTLNQLPPPQLLDVLTQMKAMAISEPQRATELLKSAPQLSYALFQALILMNLVDPKILAQVVEQATTQQAAPPQVQQPPPQQYPGYPPPPQHMAGMPPRPPPQAYPPQPPQQQAPPPQMNNNDLLQQVLAMDQRMIDSLPPNERSQIMALRAQYGVR
jgi:cleavage stimulation factor subunit 2